MMRLILALSMSLLSVTTNANDIVVNNLILQDLHLHAGQRAHHEGVLVALPRYKLYTEKFEQLTACEGALNDSIQSGVSFGEYTLVFSLGAMFGLATYLVLKH